VAHFDRAVSPGGTGKIKLTIDLKGYEGPFFKSANVLTNDPQTPHFTLHLKGRVRPVIEFKPSSIVEFKGQNPDEKSVDMIATVQPFKILRIESNLKDRLNTQIETLIPGKHYRLKISLLRKKEGFSTLLKCITDLPQKPEILIPVYYYPDISR
jgi:hypothetical protein